MNETRQPNQKAPTRAPLNRPSPSKTPSLNGATRSPSVRGGPGPTRASRGGASRSASQTSFLNTNATGDDPNDDDAKAEQAALLDELRSRVQKAEMASEEYQRQLNILQARLDESQQSHGQLEDQLHEKKEQVEELEAEKTQAGRQKRDLERIFEDERTSMIKDREELKDKQLELEASVVRLKDVVAQKDQELAEKRALSTQRDTGGSEGQFAPSLSAQREDSSEALKLVEQKERVIKSLRLELAEAQIKIMEIDSMGDGKVHELEKALLEVKVTNARLMEDNESFQLLLSEKTLNGDFSKTDAMQTSTGLGSLAEELGTEDIESAEGKSEEFRKLEIEVKSLKDQNKALALYIENIIGRLLSHKEFENILDKTPDLISGKPGIPRANTDKDLPPPPPEKDQEEQPGGGQSLLQRARSVVGGPGKTRSRPTSQFSQPAVTPPFGPTTASNLAPPAAAPNEDPTKAPSIPLGRSGSVRSGAHRRAQSEMPNAGPIVNQMYRGPPSSGSTVGGPLMSPKLSPVNPAPRTSFFAPPSPGPAAATTISPNATPRAPSGAGSRNSTHERGPGSSSNSTFSDRSGDAVDSPPRSTAGNVANNYTGAVMTQNRLRPLRLVQENPETDAKKREDDARKRANRTSWMPSWMGQRNFSGGDGTA